MSIMKSLVLLGNQRARGKGKAQRFAQELINKTSDELGEDCIPWPFALTKNGYGRLCIDPDAGTMHTHHRALWILKHGPISDDLVVRHKCRMKHCCNPNHHELGTWEDNIHDKKRDDTQNRGSEIHCSKLTEDRVREIHARAANGENQRKLAKEFGVSTHCLTCIVKARTWKHLGLPELKNIKLKPGETKGKITELEATEIHLRCSAGESRKEVAKDYNISKSAVAHIMQGRTWQHLNLGSRAWVL